MTDPNQIHLKEYNHYLSELKSRNIPNITEEQRLFRINSVESAISLIENSII